MAEDAVAHTDLGGRHPPLGGGGGDQHRPRPGACFAVALPGAGRAARAAGQLEGTAKGEIAVQASLPAAPSDAHLATSRRRAPRRPASRRRSRCPGPCPCAPTSTVTCRPRRSRHRRRTGRLAASAASAARGPKRSKPITSAAPVAAAAVRKPRRVGRAVRQLHRQHGLSPPKSGPRRARQRGSADRWRSDRDCRPARRRCPHRWGSGSRREERRRS